MIKTVIGIFWMKNDREKTSMRDRGSVVIIENKQVLLIQRISEGSIYYVFPGGGIENGETPEAGAKREALEELGVVVKVNECISEVEFNGTQYFFLAEINSGTLGTGQGEEYTDENRNRGTYLPMWVDIESLSSMDVRPKEVALKVQTLLN
jgi:8-oxo-dGTP diphosphatase